MTGPEGSPDAERTVVPSNAGLPVLATGLAAFLVANGTGELSWVRETRGAPLDWGGPYLHGVRMTGPWSTRWELGGLAEPVGWTERSVTSYPWGFQVRRSGSTLRSVDTWVVHPTAPEILLGRQLSTPDGSPLSVASTLQFSPFLAPVLLEGIRPLRFRAELRGTDLCLGTGERSVVVGSGPGPSQWSIDGTPWNGAPVEGPIRTLELRQPLLVPPGGSASSWIRVAGRHGPQLPEPAGSIELEPCWTAASRSYTDWMGQCPQLEVPGAPQVASAYRFALRSLRMLYTAPEPGFTGLLAGYPWYAALWCRDLAWMLPAVLWVGDREWVARSLDTVFAFQAPRDVPILGGSAGELPMQVSPGPIFLYGTSDTSLYYPGIVRAYLDHTGDEARAGRWFPSLERVRRWGEAKLDPGTGLFRNGGEVDRIRQASASVGKVHLGIEAPDTTIWDSADRRDHANDLQLLWLNLLRDLSAMAGRPTAPPEWAEAGAAASRFTSALPARYTWPEEQFLYDSVRSSGTPLRQLRPNALRWIGSGVLPEAQERGILDRALRADLSTPWGLRTLSSEDPTYDPSAYHRGLVWPIALAWAARAAFRLRAADLGAELLTRSARLIVEERGYSNECYRGDRPEPSDSCFLLGFSVAPFLTTIFEDLWGLGVDASEGVLRVDPRIPASWGRVALRGLPVGPGRVDLVAAPSGIEAAWSGPGPLVLAGPDASLRLEGGGRGTLTGERSTPS